MNGKKAVQKKQLIHVHVVQGTKKWCWCNRTQFENKNLKNSIKTIKILVKLYLAGVTGCL
jgi:hypothetical protein